MASRPTAPTNPALDAIWQTGPSYLASDKPLARLVARPVAAVLTVRQLPVDIRHNAKIGREKLAAWAGRQPLEDAA